jgi:nitrile hydratase accessory protein
VSGAIDHAVTEMTGAMGLPRDNGELVFEAPWQGRALAMAVGIVQRLGLGWEEFRQRLIRAIDADPDRPYYDSWLVALEGLALDHGLVSRKELKLS